MDESVSNLLEAPWSQEMTCGSRTLRLRAARNIENKEKFHRGVCSSDISNVCYLLPGHGKTPSRVYEPTGVHSEGASYGEYNSQLSQCMDCTEKHDSNQTIGDDERGRAPGGQSGSRSDEETGA